MTRPGQGEALTVWGIWTATAVLLTATYARIDPAELYHVSRDGLEGGLSRALVFANFPVSLVAIALVLVAAASLPVAAWWVAAPAIALCAVTAWPGVVEQSDLDARWINVAPALGVALALALTVAATLRVGLRFAPSLPGDWARAVIVAIVLVVSLPWIAAEGGEHLPGDMFLGEEIPRELGEVIAAVHLGHHHGLDGALLVISGLLLSRVRTSSRVSPWLTGYVGLMIGYGALNTVQDAWLEQVVKRGWTGVDIPSALIPRVHPIWLGVLGASALAVLLIVAERRRAHQPAEPRTPLKGPLRSEVIQPP